MIRASGKRPASATASRARVGIPRPAWISDRQPPLVREGEQRLDLRVRELEALGARVELDPTRAGVDAAPRLGHRVLLRVDPAEGIEPAVRRLGLAEDAVVRIRISVGLVHRHDDAASLGGRRASRSAASPENVKPSGSLKPMWPWTSRSAAPAASSSHRVLVPRPDHLVVVELAPRRPLDELEGRRAERGSGRRARARCRSTGTPLTIVPLREPRSSITSRPSSPRADATRGAGRAPRRRRAARARTRCVRSEARRRSEA